jgi:DNA ligase (NAD+)
MTTKTDYDKTIYTTFAEADQYTADQLEEIIPILDTLYEEGQDCINPLNHKKVPDNVYDALRTRLAKLRPDSEVFDDVTASELEAATTTIKHNPPMTSIDKANGTLDEKNAKLRKWMQDCAKELKYDLKRHSEENPLFVTAYKRDGVALALYYKDGKLVSAALRPRDGINGEDVTENAKYIDGIPESLPVKVTCSIRGEVECRIPVFEEIVKDIEVNGKNNKVKWNQSTLPANPRNYAVGGIHQFDDPKITKLRRLNFTAYCVEGLNNPPYKTEIERAKWVNGVLKIPFVWLKSFHYSNLKAMEEGVKELEYEVDGTVLSVNDLEGQEQLGRYGDEPTGDPKGKLAWKFEEQHADVRVTAIRWQTGRTGRVTPVIEFDGVKLAGTTVCNCTAHNVGLLEKNGVDVGAIIRVIKSGKIIPFLKSVVTPVAKVNFPSVCPSCKEKIQKVDNGDATDLVCTNKKCPAQQVQSLVHYLTTLGVKGLAESVTGKLLESGLVRCPADFYELSVEDVEKLGIGERTAYLTIARIQMISKADKIKSNDTLADKIDKAKDKIKSVPLAKLIAALGIPGAGVGTAKNATEHFKDFDKIRQASVADFEEVQDVGNITAVLLHEYFKENKDDIDALLKFVEPELPKVGKLSGKTFVFTGSPPQGKEYWIAQVEALGGAIKGSVSKKVTHVVVGADAGAKKDKAYELRDVLKLPITIITDIKDLENML